MPEDYLTRIWARKIDQLAIEEYGMTGLVLMENAGRGCADLLERLRIAGRVVICCGKGNNAGDGFVMARHLDARGVSTKVLAWCDPRDLRGDASANYEIARHAGLPIIECPGRSESEWIRRELQDADWIVDALLGTGAEGAPRAPLDSVIDVLNAQAARKFAVDLPSGLDCDTGQPSRHTFRADHTATFVAPKVGFCNESAKPYLGMVYVVDVGVPGKLLREVFGQLKASS